jgi:hypothetical protein
MSINMTMVETKDIFIAIQQVLYLAVSMHLYLTPLK